jgi:hypothetical protein
MKKIMIALLLCANGMIFSSVAPEESNTVAHCANNTAPHQTSQDASNPIYQFTDANGTVVTIGPVQPYKGTDEILISRDSSTINWQNSSNFDLKANTESVKVSLSCYEGILKFIGFPDKHGPVDTRDPDFLSKWRVLGVNWKQK